VKRKAGRANPVLSLRGIEARGEKPGRYPRKRPGFSVACRYYLLFGDTASFDARFGFQRRRLVLGFEADNASHIYRRERDGELITRRKYFFVAYCVEMFASAWDWREDARNWRLSQTACRRRSEETKLKKFRISKKAGRSSSDEAPGFAVSEATARHIHGPCLVMLDQLVKRLLRRQAFVNVDCDGHVADAKRRANSSEIILSDRCRYNRHCPLEGARYCPLAHS
jgi:hypothetical protein